MLLRAIDISKSCGGVDGSDLRRRVFSRKGAKDAKKETNVEH
jgi:hypothetical protein